MTPFFFFFNPYLVFEMDGPQILEHIQSAHAPWAGLSCSQVTLKPLEGLTNVLYLASAKTQLEHPEAEQKLLVRYYGEGTGDFINRDFENQVYKKLTKHNVGPKVLGFFEGGRLEQWIESRVPHVDELPQLSPLVAKNLAKFHKIKLSKSIPVEARLFETIDDWFQKASTTTFDDPEHVNSQLITKIDFQFIYKEFEILKSRIIELNPPIVLSHNDLQENNMLIHKTTNEIFFIDFEYSGYNYRGFDFGNHFCEWSIEYNLPTPGFKVDTKKFPNRTQMTQFITDYIGKGNESVQELVEEAHVFSLVSHLFWSLWSVLQAKKSTIGFGYLEYAIARIEAFKILKEQFVLEGLQMSR